ncbi:hypothetical protein Agub_g14573, partial [Astrephomene gubernaculifera]
AAALHGFDVAAAAAAAAGRGLAGGHAPAALGMLPAGPARVSSSSMGAAQEARGAGVAGAAGSGSGGGLKTEEECAAAAALVWAEGTPQDTVRRIAATLLARAGPGAAAGPNRMALELLLMAVRRKDPVACNKAGNLFAVLEHDPANCLSVVDDEGGTGGEVAVLDLPRMAALAEAAAPPPQQPSPAASSQQQRHPSLSSAFGETQPPQDHA